MTTSSDSGGAVAFGTSGQQLSAGSAEVMPIEDPSKPHDRDLRGEKKYSEDGNLPIPRSVGSDQRPWTEPSSSLPCHCKFLLPDAFASDFIGKSGMRLKEIMILSSCCVQISGCGRYFPGTWARVCKVNGPDIEGLKTAMAELVFFLCQWQPNSIHAGHWEDLNGSIWRACDLQIVRMIFGLGGENVRRLQRETGCFIELSREFWGMKEQLMFISMRYSMGKEGEVRTAAGKVLELLQQHEHLEEPVPVDEYVYNLPQLPKGFWSCSRNRLYAESAPPGHPSCRLMSPEQAKFKSKRQLVEYLWRVAPHIFLLSKRCSIEDTTHRALLEAVEDLWVSNGQPFEPFEPGPVAPKDLLTKRSRRSVAERWNSSPPSAPKP